MEKRHHQAVESKVKVKILDYTPIMERT